MGWFMAPCLLFSRVHHYSQLFSHVGGVTRDLRFRYSYSSMIFSLFTIIHHYSSEVWVVPPCLSEQCQRYRQASAASSDHDMPRMGRWTCWAYIIAWDFHWLSSYCIIDHNVATKFWALPQIMFKLPVSSSYDHEIPMVDMLNVVSLTVASIMLKSPGNLSESFASPGA